MNKKFLLPHFYIKKNFTNVLGNSVKFGLEVSL